LGKGGLAGGLQGFEADGTFGEGAVDALLVEGEELEVTGLLDPGLSGIEGGIDFGIAGVGGGVGAFGEDGVLEGAGALETPGVFGWRLPSA
jgi:hypothetical protein